MYFGGIWDITSINQFDHHVQLQFVHCHIIYPYHNYISDITYLEKKLIVPLMFYKAIVRPHLDPFRIVHGGHIIIRKNRQVRKSATQGNFKLIPELNLLV